MSPEHPATPPPICDYEGSDYQTRFWEQGGRAYEDQVEAVALRRLLPPTGDLLLEIGAGAGRNTPRYRGYQRIALLDYSFTQLQQAQQRLGRASKYVYVVADAYQLPFLPGLFATATMIRVLHHMADAPRVLHQVGAALRPGGIFILEFANKRNLKAILRYILGRQEWNPFSPEPVEFATLNFDFHPRTVRAWLAEAGLNVERQLTVSHFRINLLKRSLPLRLLVWMDALLQWTGAVWQLTPSVFVRARAASRPVNTGPEAFFRCPACSQPLPEADAHLPWRDTTGTAPTGKISMTCSTCQQAWSFQDGIFVFK